MQSFFKNLVKFYRFFFSPLMGGGCRFYPTCSAYALEAFEHLSVGQAILKVAKRILSCHPFHPGGYDPLITEEKSERRRVSLRSERSYKWLDRWGERGGERYLPPIL